jgi:hypothetical protein
MVNGRLPPARRGQNSTGVCRVRGLIQPAALGTGRDRLLRIVAMLTRMVLNCTEKGG